MRACTSTGFKTAMSSRGPATTIWYCPDLRAALRRTAEVLAKGEPEVEHISDEELEKIVRR